LYAVKATEAEYAEKVYAAAAETGADRWRTPFGLVTVARRKPTIGVTDEQALTAWVAENHPSEIVTTVTVRDSFRRSVLERLGDGHDGTVIDTETGEVITWATVIEGSPYLSVRGAEKDAAVQGWRDMLVAGMPDVALGQVQPPALPASDG